MNNYVLVSQGLTVYISKSRAHSVSNLLKNGDAYVEIDDRLIRVGSIYAILPVDDYIKSRKTARQNWLCNYGNVHTPEVWCQCSSAPAISTDRLPELTAQDS